MLKNKSIPLFFVVFLILCILIDYSIFNNKEVDNANSENEVINKSIIIIQLDSKIIEQSGAFFQARKEYSSAIVNEISKNLNYFINKSNIGKFHQNNYFNSRYIQEFDDKYFTFDYEIITEDWLYGKLYFEIKTFSNIKDEPFTNYILENLKLILQEQNERIFSIIYSLTKHFISNENDLAYKEFSNIIEKNDYKTSIDDNLSAYILSNQVYDPNEIGTYKRFHILPNFIPIFTIFFILLSFIFFIFLTIKKNLKI